MKIILDSNVLLYAAKQRADLINQIREKFGRIEIIVPDLVIKELKTLSEKAKKGSDKRAAKLTLQLIKFSKLKIVKVAKGHVDERIIELAKKEKAVVVTNDSKLKAKLKKEGILVLTLRQRKLVTRDF